MMIMTALVYDAQDNGLDDDNPRNDCFNALQAHTHTLATIAYNDGHLGLALNCALVCIVQLICIHSRACLQADIILLVKVFTTVQVPLVDGSMVVVVVVGQNKKERTTKPGQSQGKVSALEWLVGLD